MSLERTFYTASARFPTLKSMQKLAEKLLSLRSRFHIHCYPCIYENLFHILSLKMDLLFPAGPPGGRL